MHVLIVGAGAMGRWIGETLVSTDRDGSDTVALTFADVDPDAAREAAASIEGDARAVPASDSGLDPLDAAADPGLTVDVVCLAVPMPHVEAAVERYGPLAERAVIDVAGVMATPLEAMATHTPGLERVSLHPLFAPERAPGSIATVTAAAGPTSDRILGALEVAGNRLVETTAAEHDRAMESVQSAAHAAVLAFALAADPVPEGFETPIFAELEQLTHYVTDGTPRVYRDIQQTFDGADAVADAAQRIADAEDEAFDDLYRAARERWAGADRLQEPRVVDGIDDGTAEDR